MLALLLIPYAVALLFAIADLRGRFAQVRIPTPHLSSGTWTALSAALYVVQNGVVWWAAAHQADQRFPYSMVPFPILDMRSAPNDVLTVVFVVLATVQTYALLGLYRSNPARATIALGFAFMAAVSLCAPALTSFDPYGYIHNAILGRLAYTPPESPFPGEYHVIDLWFGRPTSTVYGPLWLPLVAMIVGGVSGLLAKLLALRAANLLFFIALLALLSASGLPRRILAVAALNPALLFQFVANAHNDVIAVTVLLLGVHVVRRSAVLASGIVAVAGLIKLPYAILGLPMFAAVRPVWRRVLVCGAAIAATLVLSWYGGGHAYLHSLQHYGIAPGPWRYWHLPVLFAAGVLLLVAIAGGRRYRSAVWLMPVIGTFGIPFVYPWYFLWGLIYALPRHRVLGHLLVGFPLAAALVQDEFRSPITLLVLFPVVAALLCLPRQPATLAERAA